MTKQSKQEVEATTPSNDDTYCPTSDTGRAADCSEENHYEDDASLDEAISAFQWAILQKQEEFFVLGDVVAAEVNVAKKSIIVTGLSTLAAFVFACFCWLIINIFMVVGLHHAGVHFAIIAAVALCLNGACAYFAFRIAKQTYRYISLMPALHALLGGAGIKREQGE